MSQRISEPGHIDEETARLRETLEHTPNVSVQWYDLDGRITYWNPASETVFGYPAEQALGRTLDELIFTPEDAAAFAAILDRLHKHGGSAGPCEFRFRRKDGTRGVCLSTVFSLPASPGQPRFACMDVDITARQSAERALRDSEARLRAVIAALPDAVFVLDQSGELGDVRAVHHAWPFDPTKQPKGRLIHELLPAELVRKIVDEIPVSVEAGSCRVIEYALEIDGRNHWFESRIVPYGEAQVLVVVRDRTEQRLAEQNRLRAEAHLRQAQKLESLGVMAAGIAHDFNNILTGMLGYCGLARSRAADHPGLAAAITEIEALAKRATTLCQQMLTYSGHDRLVTESIDLNRLCREVVEVCPEIGRARIRTRFDDVPVPVELDGAQVRQAVLNLLMNAVEALESLSGVVLLSCGRFKAERADFAGAVIDDDLPPGEYGFVEVTDTGRGMEAGELSRIFDPFYSTKSVGRGLGLSAVLGIIRAHRGAVFVRSQPGRGSTFRIALPLALPRVPSAPVGRPGRVLVIDSDPEVCGHAKQVLEPLGYSVTCVSDGPAALAAVRRVTADVVLLDLTLPKFAGLDVFNELRQISSGVPIVLTSGFHGDELRRVIDVPGPVRYMRKPFGADELTQAVEGLQVAESEFASGNGTIPARR